MLFQLLTQHSGTKQALDPGWGGGCALPGVHTPSAFNANCCTPPSQQMAKA